MLYKCEPPDTDWKHEVGTPDSNVERFHLRPAGVSMITSFTAAVSFLSAHGLVLNNVSVAREYRELNKIRRIIWRKLALAAEAQNSEQIEGALTETNRGHCR